MVNSNIQRRLASGLFWILLLNLLVKPFWLLGIEMGVQNAVGAEEYGLYFALFNLAYIFNILLDCGVTNFNTRNIAQHPQLIGKHLPHLLGIKCLLLGFYLLVTFGVGLLCGYGSRQFLLLAILCLNQFLNSLILYLRSNFEGLLLFRWDSLLSILDRVVMIAICGLMLWGPRGGTTVELFALSQTVAYLLTLLTALVVLLARTGRPRPLLRLNRPFTLVILKQSFPFALLVLLMASYNRIDPLLLSWLRADGQWQAGIYAGAFRLLDALTMIAYLVSVPLLPVFSRMTASSTPDKALRPTLLAITAAMLLFSLSASLLLSAHSQPLMQLFFHQQASPYAQVFRILIYCIIPISMTYVYGTLLTAAGRLTLLNLLAATTLLLGIGLNLTLTPRLGAVGAAWASLSAQSFMAASQIVASLFLLNGKRPRD